MYCGPGASTLRAVAAVWSRLAADLYAAAAQYQAVIAGLVAGPWMGPSSALMASAAARYLVWLNVTAANVEVAGIQLSAGAAAYETAFGLMVPPPVIAANRAQLQVLIVTNFFGQNLEAIAETEVEYIEMWLQCATAMYDYAGSAAAASVLTPFEEAPETTNPAGWLGEIASVEEAVDVAAAQQIMSRVSVALEELAQPVPTPQAPPPPPVPGAAGAAGAVAPAPGGMLSSLASAWTTISPHFSPLSSVVSMLSNHVSMLNSGVSMTNTMSSLLKGMAPAAAGAVESAVQSEAAALGSALSGGLGASGLGVSGVAGSLGEAALVGKLSVPQAWEAENQAGAPAVRALPPTGGSGAIGTGQLLGGLPMGAASRPADGNAISSVFRVAARRFVMPRPPAAG